MRTMFKVKMALLSFWGFIKSMFKYPTTPKENWQDMISTYKLSTDKEFIELTDILFKDKNEKQ